MGLAFRSCLFRSGTVYEGSILCFLSAPLPTAFGHILHVKYKSYVHAGAAPTKQYRSTNYSSTPGGNTHHSPPPFSPGIKYHSAHLYNLTKPGSCRPDNITRRTVNNHTRQNCHTGRLALEASHSFIRGKHIEVILESIGHSSSERIHTQPYSGDNGRENLLVPMSPSPHGICEQTHPQHIYNTPSRQTTPSSPSLPVPRRSPHRFLSARGGHSAGQGSRMHPVTLKRKTLRERKIEGRSG